MLSHVVLTLAASSLGALGCFGRSSVLNRQDNCVGMEDMCVCANMSKSVGEWQVRVFCVFTSGQTIALRTARQ